jgi:hypothetical protein
MYCTDGEHSVRQFCYNVHTWAYRVNTWNVDCINVVIIKIQEAQE